MHDNEYLCLIQNMYEAHSNVLELGMQNQTTFHIRTIHQSKIHIIMQVSSAVSNEVL